MNTCPLEELKKKFAEAYAVAYWAEKGSPLQKNAAKLRDRLNQKLKEIKDERQTQAHSLHNGSWRAGT